MILIANDNLIELLGLRDEASGQYITDATVECTLYDEDENEISGESWPLTMAYLGTPVTVDGVTYADGNYRAVLNEALALGDDQKVFAFVDAEKDATQQHWEYPDVARIRRY